MENKEIMNKEIGTKETIQLQPGMVKILDVEIQDVGDKGHKKFVCKTKHPSKDEPILISSAKVEIQDKLKTIGLWVNLDEDKNIRKDSAMAMLLKYLGCKKPVELINRELMSIEDEKGYLTFKAY